MNRWHEMLKWLALILIGLIAVEVALWGLWSGNDTIIALLIAVLITYATILSRLLGGNPDVWKDSIPRKIWVAVFDKPRRLVLACLLLTSMAVIIGWLAYRAWHLRLCGHILYQQRPVSEVVAVTIYTSERTVTCETSNSRFKISLSRTEAKDPVGISAESQHFRTRDLIETSEGNVSVVVERRHKFFVQVTDPCDPQFQPNGIEVVAREVAKGKEQQVAKTDETGTAFFEASSGSQWRVSVFARSTYISKNLVINKLPYTFEADISKASSSQWASIEDAATSEAVASAVIEPSEYSTRVFRALASAGEAPNVPATFEDPQLAGWLPDTERLLTRTAYLAGYNDELRIPNWVAYALEGEYQPHSRPARFSADEELPESVRATDEDYRFSGYDRGSLASFSDMCHFGPKAAKEAMLLSCVCPQTRELNQYVWLRIEKLARQAKDRFGKVYILAGPAFMDDESDDSVIVTIGKNKIPVPTHFFRVHAAVINGQLSVLSFLVPNEVPRESDIAEFLVSVDAIEAATSLDFFKALPDDIENELESNVPDRLWPIP